MTAAQARILVDIAKTIGLFLMEALWTRFLPVSIEITNIIARGDVGRVYRVLADNSLPMDPGDKSNSRWKPEGRLLNPSLAGGVLLDSGVYSLSWVFMCLYHTLPEKERRAPRSVVGVVDKYKGTGVDEGSSVIVAFEKGPGGGVGAAAVEEEGEGAQGIATCSFRVATDPEGKQGAWGAGIRIQASKAEIQILGPAYRFVFFLPSPPPSFCLFFLILELDWQWIFVYSCGEGKGRLMSSVVVCMQNDVLANSMRTGLDQKDTASYPKFFVARMKESKRKNSIFPLVTVT